MAEILSCFISAFLLWRFLIIFYTTQKKKIQNLVFPNVFFINPGTRQYLTPEINQLFRLTTQISMSSEETKKRIPIKNDEDSVVVDYFDEISNFLLIKDFMKVSDFVEEMNIISTST
jgi:hypothetical protein